MKDYLDRFKVMVDEMMAEPRVRVTNFWVGEAVTDDEIARVEKHLGYSLDASILDFYRQANGLQFRWLDTASPNYVEGRDDQTHAEPVGYLQGDNDEADGVVNILPLGECFVDRSYEEMLYFDWMNDDDKTEFAGKEYGQLEFAKALRPVDPFSFYNSMGFFLGSGSSNPPLIMGDDHDACWTDSYVTDFRSYLELILQHRGNVQIRRDTFGQYAGHRNDPVVIESKPIIGLDEILPPIKEFEAGDRVVFNDPYNGASVRATVVGHEEGSTKPDYWDRNTKFLRVRTDHGEEVLLNTPPNPVEGEDAFETAMKDPALFFERLMSGTPRERFDTLGSIALGTGSYMMQNLDPREGASTEDLEVRIADHAWRYHTISSRLDAAVAVDAWVTLIEDFLDDTHYDQVLPAPPAAFPDDYRYDDNARYESVVELAVNALTLEIFRAYDEAPFNSLRARFEDRNADRILALADRLEGLRINAGASEYSNTEFLRRAVESLPATIQRSQGGSGYRGAQFGLDDLPVI